MFVFGDPLVRGRNMMIHIRLGVRDRLKLQMVPKLIEVQNLLFMLRWLHLAKLVIRPEKAG